MHPDAPYFSILLCLMSYDFTCQVESAATHSTQWVTGREITAGQRTMSGQKAELSVQILTLPVILNGHFR
jgi:hypothetical protein